MMFAGTKRRQNNNDNNDDESQMGNFDESNEMQGEEETGYNANDEIIDINVGGKKFQTYSKTLERFPKSLLGDTQRRNQFYNPNTGELFFDRHRPTFESILYYYQSGGIMARPPNIPIHIFVNELIFFDIGDAIIEKLQIDNGLKEVKVQQDMPTFEPFRVLWLFLENPESSRPAKIFAISSVVVIVISLIMFVIETLPTFSSSERLINNGTTIEIVPSEHESWMFTVNTAVICWFTIEFILRLICCPNKLKFFVNTGNIIDFLSIIPYYLSLALAKSSDQSSFSMLRVIRVLRVFKLSRHSRGLQILGNTLKASFNELMMLAFFLFVMILIFGSCVYYAEYKEPGTKFISIPSSFWWAIVTMTTVGYGDMHPETFWGQIVGSMAVVCGVLTIALPVPVVVSNFEYFYTKERNRRKTEEARKEQAKSKQERLFRESATSKLDMLRNYAKSIKRKSTRKSSKDSRKTSTVSNDDKGRDDLNLDNYKPNGSCPYPLKEEDEQTSNTSNNSATAFTSAL